MKRKILSDVALNMFATFIPMFALQFFILPQIALKIDANLYGQIIAIVALINLSAGSLGSILNNSRLIVFKKYDDLEIQGDFNIFLGIFVLLNILFMILGLMYYGQELDLLTIALLVLVSVLLLLRTYASVDFRIKLNFKYILIDSILLFSGYAVGYIIFLISGYWLFIYLCGFVFSFIFVLKKTKILREPFKKTQLFKKTATQTLLLLGSGTLLSLGTYLDKLLLYPLLGGLTVSIYFTATILGQSIALAIGPITGVLLSYLAQMKKFSNHSFHVLLTISSIVGVIGYWLVILVSKPLLTIIYPQYAKEALNYIHVTTLSIIIIIISNIINAVLLKFCGAKWQIFINGIYLVVYIAASMILLNLYGLMGFCIGILIASIVKLVIMLVTYYTNNKKYDEQKIDLGVPT